MAVGSAPEDITLTLPREVMRMAREALASGLYGDSIDEAVVALLRPGLLEAVRIGAARMATSKRK